MHTAVLTCDFLLAPAYCDADEINCRVGELAEYARSVQARNESPMIEEDAVGKMQDLGSYPCDSLFKSNLARLEEPAYSVKDISRVITGILASANSFEYSATRLWESQNVTLTPNFKGLSPERTKQLHRLAEEVAVFNELEEFNYSILHYCKHNVFSQIKVDAELDAIYPNADEVLPYIFECTIELYSSYPAYLSSICLEQDLLNDPENIDLMREQFYWGGLIELKKRDRSLKSFASTNFAIGSEFIESLKMNQCLPGQRFWSSCFSSVVAVLTNDETYEINPFRKSAKSDEQRTSGEFKAYRCHVTKSSVALRLMFWKNSDGVIVLANIGPKNEEKIEDP